MSNKRIHVGNLSFESTDGDIRTAFETFGVVHDVAVITDRETGRSRGFAFVEMDADAAATAIEQLNGKDLGGRDLTVTEARARVVSSPR
jgi:RNA recognition motif-containing protein